MIKTILFTHPLRPVWRHLMELVGSEIHSRFDFRLAVTGVLL
jgi:hypothetical protein